MYSVIRGSRVVGSTLCHHDDNRCTSLALAVRCPEFRTAEFGLHYEMYREWIQSDKKHHTRRTGRRVARQGRCFVYRERCHEHRSRLGRPVQFALFDAARRAMLFRFYFQLGAPVGTNHIRSVQSTASSPGDRMPPDSVGGRQRRPQY